MEMIGTKHIMALAFAALVIVGPAHSLAAQEEVESTPGVAGGSGAVMMDGQRVFIGIYADAMQNTRSSLKFSGHIGDARVEIIDVERAWFASCHDGGYPSVHMKGEALVNGTDTYRFHFKATDKGGGEADTAWLKLWPAHHDDGHDEGHDEHESDEAILVSAGCDCSEATPDDGTESCDGGEDSGHSGIIKWSMHGLSSGDIWVTMKSGPGIVSSVADGLSAGTPLWRKPYR